TPTTSKPCRRPPSRRRCSSSWHRARSRPTSRRGSPTSRRARPPTSTATSPVPPSTCGPSGPTAIQEKADTGVRYRARMTERWRYLDLDRQGPYENGATMPVLVRSVAEHGEPIAQTSVWGQTHLNVGWFDDVDATLDLDRCADLGVEVIRRQV